MNYNLTKQVAGPSVYRARDMYALINDTLQYSDSAVCAFEGYFRESSNILYPNFTKIGSNINYFKAQPNPASDHVLFTFGENESAGNLIIYNLSGKTIYNSTLNANTSKLSIDISNFAKGIYIAHFVNNNSSSRLKFVVK
jgi:hypothetical protein